MQNFIDLAGVSGATYRFHRVEDMEKLPAIAGNFVYVRTEGESSVVVCCGTDETLLRAGVRWPDAMQSHGADTVYVRKNVSWRVRATEHEDIAKQHRPPLIVAKELDRQS